MEILYGREHLLRFPLLEALLRRKFSNSDKEEGKGEAK